MNRVYLAGKWEEHDLIDGYAKLLEAIGYSITLPWFRLHKGNYPLDKGATEDLQGVADADICIFIFERELPYSGAMSELGAALALNKRVYIVGHGGDRNIFTHHPAVIHLEVFAEMLAEAI